MSTKYILVDDTSPSVVYSAGWNLERNVAAGSNGSAYNSTLHLATANSASFSFDFTGTFIQIFGSLNEGDTGRSPNWTCQLFPVIDENSPDAPSFSTKAIEGTKILTAPPVSAQMNNFALCQNLSFRSSLYRMTLVVTFDANPHGELWFDYAVYRPPNESSYYDPVSPSLSDPVGAITNGDNTIGDGRLQIVKVQSNDTDVQYVGSWSSSGSIMQTTTVGNFCKLTFRGRTVALYGNLTAGQPTSASYSIDQSPTVSFQLDPAANGTTLLNQLLFQSEDIPGSPEQQHIILVSFGGGSSPQIPLTVDYFLVGVEVLNPSLNGTHGEGGSNSTSPGLGGPSKRSNKGEIIGGAFGGAIGIFILMLFGAWYRHQRKGYQVHWGGGIEPGPVPKPVRNEVLGPGPVISSPEHSPEQHRASYDPYGDRAHHRSLSVGSVHAESGLEDMRNLPARPIYAITPAQMRHDEPPDPETITRGGNLDEKSRAISAFHAFGQSSGQSSGSVRTKTESQPLGEARSTQTSNNSARRSNSSPLSTQYESRSPIVSDPVLISGQPPQIVRHQDSGIRMAEGPRSTSAVVDLPPDYTPT